MIQENIDISDFTNDTFRGATAPELDAGATPAFDLQNNADTDPTAMDTPAGYMGPVRMGLSGVTPDYTDTAAQAAASTDGSEDASTDTPTAAQTGTPTEKELQLFKKFHASEFNANSSMDRKKMEQLRQSAQQVGADDENLLRSTTYAKQYGNDAGNAGASSKPLETEAEKRKRLLSPVQGMFVRTGFNQFRPAVQADVDAGTPLSMQNPNPVLRQINPYVSVDRTAMKAKKATAVDQQAIDKEMAARGAQRLGPAGVRTEKGGRKERKSNLPGAAGSLSNFFGDVGNSLTRK